MGVQKFISACLLGSATMLVIYSVIVRNPILFSRRAIPTATISQTEHESQKKQEWIETTLAGMSLEEQVGQLWIFGINEASVSAETNALIQSTQPGGFLIMGKHSSQDITPMTNAIQNHSSTIPFFIAIDQEGGPVKRIVDDTNPGAFALRNESLETLSEAVHATSFLLDSAGININFGIVADIGWNPDAYITNRTFGDTPASVSASVLRAVEATKPVLSAVKHFPGHGRTKQDSHQTLPHISLSLDEWKKTDAVPFQKAIDAGVDAIMIGHLIYDAVATTPASLSPQAYDLLRSMGFQGLAITDDLSMLQSSGYTYEKIVKNALISGADAFVYVGTNEDCQKLYDLAVSTVKKNSTLAQTVADHVRRILEKKYRFRK